ncbi:MAG: hypothetical protein VXX46_01855 [Bacteroidota bacterium]|nr:hypothetical protein [Bacteroidota bacterium]
MKNHKQPKKRGRKPGSKNKNKRATLLGAGNTNSLFENLQQDLINSIDVIERAKEIAEKEIAKMEQRHQRDLERQRIKLEGSISLWKNRAKEYRQKLTTGGTKRRKVGRPALKPMAKRGRPAGVPGRKGGGRKKAGELTKRDIIIAYMNTQKNPITSKQLIEGLFKKSDETDVKRFSQGIYTTLTTIYRRGDLVNEGGYISVPK